MTDLCAGRELDALVAEKVMGWTELEPSTTWSRWKFGDPGDRWTETEEEWCRGVGINPGSERYTPFPLFSTDISAAWEVVNTVSAIEWGFALFHYPGLSSAGFGYVVAFARSLRPYSLEIVTLGDPEKVKHAHSNSLPEAICLAAIQTVDGIR